MVRTNELKSPPPFNISIRKNLAYNVFSRQFLYWALAKSDKAKALLEWSRDTLTPDEHYWLMLDALKEAQGRTGKISWGSVTPHVVWKGKNRNCSGNLTFEATAVLWLCIIGLRSLLNARHLNHV